MKIAKEIQYLIMLIISLLKTELLIKTSLSHYIIMKMFWLWQYVLLLMLMLLLFLFNPRSVLVEDISTFRFCICAVNIEARVLFLDYKG